jgi:CheY-like chemotaxis protein
MPNGGDLYIETKNVLLDEDRFKAYGKRKGRYVKISVTDTGIGMDEKTKERIFEPFFTTKEMGHGTGLGLASVYGIIKNHNGFINVYSEKEKGTTFNIYLPASTASDEKDGYRTLNVADDILCTETILLVDDEDMVLNVAGDMIKTMGYTVMTASDGSTAVNTYRDQHQRIDLVMLDMVMPDMSGGDVFDEIKKINPQAKVLLSSGYSLNGQASRIMERGCNGFIQKPFTLDEISTLLRQILGQSRKKK